MARWQVRALLKSALKEARPGKKGQVPRRRQACCPATFFDRGFADPSRYAPGPALAGREPPRAEQVLRGAARRTGGYRFVALRLCACLIHMTCM